MSINIELKNIVCRMKPWNSLTLECEEFYARGGEKYFFVSPDYDQTARALVSLCAMRLKPVQGQVFYDGKPFKTLSPASRRHMVFMDCHTVLDSWLTVFEYLHLCGRLSGRKEAAISLDIQNFLHQNHKVDLLKRPLSSLGRLDNIIVRIIAAGLFLPSLLCADLSALELSPEEGMRVMNILEAVSKNATLIACMNTDIFLAKYRGPGQLLQASNGRVVK